MQSHTSVPAEGIEIVTSLLPKLTEAVREGHTRHFADITEEEDPEGDEPMVVGGNVIDVRLGRPDSQPEPELNAPANSNASPHSARSETHAEPEAEVSTSAGTDMEIGVRITVFCSAIVIDVIVHCHTAGALLSQTAENNCPYHRVVGFRSFQASS